jgi:hypothetical protein
MHKTLGEPKNLESGAPNVLKKGSTANGQGWARNGEAQHGGRSNLPDGWRRWVAENKILRTPEENVIAALLNAGIDQQDAVAEVRMVATHPYVKAAEPTAHRAMKLESLLDIQHKLASLSFGNGTVERRSRISRAEFLERYYAANRPVILTGLLASSRALARWTPEFLQRTCGEMMVEIMAGRDQDARYEVNSVRHKQIVKFASYIRMVIDGGPSNDYYLVANNGFLGRPEAKPLIDDLWTFPEYLDPKKAEGQVFFWFGPRGTVTPLHHDIMNVFMAQIYGNKRLLLVAPDQTHLVYNHIGVYSEVNPETPDFDRYPRFRQAQVISAEIGPGDVIFLPVGWWHHVRSLSTSITVSYTNFVFPNQYEWVHPNLAQ